MPAYVATQENIFSGGLDVFMTIHIFKIQLGLFALIWTAAICGQSNPNILFLTAHSPYYRVTDLARTLFESS